MGTWTKWKWWIRKSTVRKVSRDHLLQLRLWKKTTKMVFGKSWKHKSIFCFLLYAIHANITFVHYLMDEEAYLFFYIWWIFAWKFHFTGNYYLHKMEVGSRIYHWEDPSFKIRNCFLSNSSYYILSLHNIILNLSWFLRDRKRGKLPSLSR